VKALQLAIFFVGFGPLFAQTNPAKLAVPASVNLDKVLMLYGELSGRTVLRHPDLSNKTFVLNHTTTNRAELVRAIETAFTEKEIIAIPDGEKFVLVGLKSQAAHLVPGATNLPATKTKPYPKGTIDFHNASMAPVLSVYAAVLGKKLDQTSPLPVAGEVTLIQTCELTKEEILYAFETLMRWKDWDLISVNEQIVRVVPRPRPAAK
jgi:hypothetical protein